MRFVFLFCGCCCRCCCCVCVCVCLLKWERGNRCSCITGSPVFLVVIRCMLCVLLFVFSAVYFSWFCSIICDDHGDACSRCHMCYSCYCDAVHYATCEIPWMTKWSWIQPSSSFLITIQSHTHESSFNSSFGAMLRTVGARFAHRG